MNTIFPGSNVRVFTGSSSPFCQPFTWFSSSKDNDDDDYVGGRISDKCPELYHVTYTSVVSLVKIKFLWLFVQKWRQITPAWFYVKNYTFLETINLSLCQSQIQTQSQSPMPRLTRDQV